MDNTVDENIKEQNFWKEVERENIQRVIEKFKKLFSTKEVEEVVNNIQQIKQDLKKKKVPELKKICKEKGIIGYLKF